MERPWATRFFVGLSAQYLAANLWNTVLLWQLLVLTHSAWWLALGTAATTVPTLLVGVTGPEVGDRGSLAQWLMAQGVLLGIGALLAAHSASLLVLLALVGGWVSARAIPRAQAEMMRRTDRAEIPRASRRYEVASRVGMTVGPLLAGWLLSARGASLAMACGGALFAVGAIVWQGFVAAMPVPTRGSTAVRLRAAVGDVTGDRFLRTALTVRSATNIAWPAFTLAIPIMVLSVWHAHAVSYGLFGTVWGVSTVVATLAAVPLLRSERLQEAFFAAWVISGVGFLLIGVSPTVQVALAMTMFTALGGPLVHIALDTHIGRSLAPDRQGHVFALQRLLMSVSGLVGSAIVSGVLTWAPPALVLDGAGIAMAIATSVGYLAWRRAKPDAVTALDG